MNYVSEKIKVPIQQFRCYQYAFQELSTLTYGKKQVFRTPLIAKYVYLSMKNIPGNLTCIKLELYGCRATLVQGNKLLKHLLNSHFSLIR